MLFSCYVFTVAVVVVAVVLAAVDMHRNVIFFVVVRQLAVLNVRKNIMVLFVYKKKYYEIRWFHFFFVNVSKRKKKQ